jgi:predicted nuclease of predicted toxin-antitoxin system
MKFLIDQALSPLLADRLKLVGYDVVHVRDYGMQKASDNEILSRADKEDRILLSADNDFGTILAQLQASKPSVIIFRGNLSRRPLRQIDLLLLNLPQLQLSLEQGSIVVMEEGRIRVRSLPI